MRAEDHTQALAPLMFAGKACAPWIQIMGFVVPACFIVLKASGLQVGTTQFANSAVHFISFVWPVFDGQYRMVATVAGESNAVNYAVFGVVSFLVLAAFIGRGAILMKRYALAPIDKSDLWLVALLAGLSGFGLLFDRAVVAPNPLQDFYVDSLGLYYFRQGILVSVVHFTVFSALVLAVNMICRLRRIS